jgi:iron complex outermembrane recepter protein
LLLSNTLNNSIDKNTSAYGVYDQAFVPQAGSDVNGNSFEPITGNNMEIGIKREWFGGNWLSSLSLYQITKNNVLTTDPSNVNFSIQLGQTQTKGVEFDLRGQITDNLNLTANYAYTDGVITKDSDPTRINLDIPGISTHIANTWLTYRFSDKIFKGFGLSLRGQYQAGHKSWRTTEGASEGSLPNYFRLDGAVSYYLYSGGYYSYGSFYYWQAEALINSRLNITYKF